jgi:hypothetical protein
LLRLIARFSDAFLSENNMEERWQLSNILDTEAAIKKSNGF